MSVVGKIFDRLFVKKIEEPVNLYPGRLPAEVINRLPIQYVISGSEEHRDLVSKIEFETWNRYPEGVQLYKNEIGYNAHARYLLMPE